MKEANKGKDLHELVEEKEKEHATWRRSGYVGAAVVLLAVAIGIAFLWRESLADRITTVEGLEDPCVVDVHSDTCQDRTCTRLLEVGYVLSPECLQRLGGRNRNKRAGSIRSGGQVIPLQPTTSSGSRGVTTPETARPRQPSATRKKGGARSPGNNGGGSETGREPTQILTPGNPARPTIPSVCVDNPLLPICLNIK